MSYQIFVLPILALKHLISCVFRGPDSTHRSQSLYTCRSAFHIPAWSKWTHVLVPSMMDDLFKRFLDDHLLKGQLLRYFLDGEVSMPSLPPNRRRIWLNLMASSTEMPLEKTQHFLHFTRQKAGTHVVASGSCSPMVPQCNNFSGLNSNLPSKNDGTRLPIMINIIQFSQTLNRTVSTKSETCLSTTCADLQIPSSKRPVLQRWEVDNSSKCSSFAEISGVRLRTQRYERFG